MLRKVELLYISFHILKIIYFGCEGSFLLPRLFSSCRELEQLSSCAQASHCSDFSCCGAQALGCPGFSSCHIWAQQLQLLGSGAQTEQLRHTGLVASRHVGSFQTRLESVSPSLAGGFFTTESLGKPLLSNFKKNTFLECGCAHSVHY